MLKTKSKRERHHSTINTVDGKHRDFVLNFRKQKNLLPKKKDKLEKLEKELVKINKMEKEKYTNDILKRRAQIKSEIKLHEREIFDIENSVSELDYYSTAGDLLVDYYDTVDGHKNATDNITSIGEISSISNRKLEEREISDLDKLNMLNKTKKKVKKPTKTRYKKTIQNIKKKNILDFFGNKKGDEKKNTSKSDTFKTREDNNTKSQKKATILDEYLMLVDGAHVGAKFLKQKNITLCKSCGGEKKPIASDGICVCIECGETEMIIIESDRPNYKDPIPEKSGYPYKRQNHFQEWLSQFQAKESTEIPKEVFDRIIIELKKSKIYDWKKLNLSMMKQILKKLELNSYYEHIPHIISKLSGVEAPKISRETEETLRSMFKEIQEPFEAHCPKDRVNFLSYSYVLHKFCELLELDEFLKCFPLLKNREKLRQQDKIWKKICYDLRWEYIPSV